MRRTVTHHWFRARQCRRIRRALAQTDGVTLVDAMWLSDPVVLVVDARERGHGARDEKTQHREGLS